MKIKDGINGEETEIRACKSGTERVAELGIDQTGLTTARQETLSYITLDELLDLKEEINKVIKEITK